MPIKDKGKPKWRLTENIWKLMLALVVLLSTTGCWDEVDLQDISYVSAMGLDYVDNQFVAYAQIISFDSVAKKESMPSNKEPIWTGHAEGSSTLDAIFNLTRSSQYVISLDHLKSIVIHERAFPYMKQMIDGINRLRATRFTSLIFGTKSSIEELFETDTFYNSTPLTSTLYSPRISYEQISFVQPLTMQKFIRSALEPGMTTILPAMERVTGQWNNDGKPMRLNVISGLFTFKGDKFGGYFPKNKMAGIIWDDPKFSQATVNIVDNGEQAATIMVDHSHTEIKASWQAGKPRFRLKASLTGHLIEVAEKLDREQMTALMEKTVAQQIKDTYLAGVAQGVDLYQLEHNLYRYHNKEWKKLKEQGNWKPKADDLAIEVNCLITHPGELEVNR